MQVLRRDGTRALLELPAGEEFVALTQFQGVLYVASTRRVFRLRAGDDALVPIDIVVEPEP
jgi:hypothetical protein